MIWSRQTYIPVGLSILVMFMLGRSWPVDAQTYLYPDPALSPPSGQLAPPLNTSLNAQQKLGSLFIGRNGDAFKLCLNADASQPLSLRHTDPNCLSSWNDLAGIIGNYIRLHQDVISGNTLDPEAYNPVNATTKPGFIRLQPLNASSLLFTLLAQAGDTSGSNRATGLLASDNNIGSAYAASLGGRMFLHPQGANLSRICLNGNPGRNPASCIAHWGEITGTNLRYVRLQNNNSPSATSPNQTGSAAVRGTFNTATTGVEYSGSIIAGEDTGLPLASTCGDGFCSAVTSPAEDGTSCAVDCAAVSQLSSFTAQAAGHEIFLSGSVNAPPGTSKEVVIVRATNATPDFVPQTGVKYVYGMAFGNSTIVYAQLVTGNFQVPVEKALTKDVTYHYHAYQGNLFPRYSAPLLRTVDLPLLPLWNFGAGMNGAPGAAGSGNLSGGGSGSPINLFCNPTCTGTYTDGSQISLNADIVPDGYVFDHWEGYAGCSTDTTCVVEMYDHTTVNAYFVPI